MSSRVRLLPALIGAAGVLLALRLGAMASSAEQTPPADQAKPATADTVAATPIAPAAEAAAAPAAPSAPATPGEPSCQPASAPAGQAQTKGEAEVLQNLSQRREALDARERDLGMREQLMSATEKQMSERLAELKTLQGTLDTMLAQRDAAEEVQIASLVKTYENMKPTDAAKIFNKLDRQVMFTVASRMKPAKIGAVMAAMDAARAQELTVMLATHMKLAKPAVQAAAPPPPPAPAMEVQPQAAAATPAPPPT